MTSPHDPVLSIDCDDCVMRDSAACEDCLVTYLWSEPAGRPDGSRAVVLDLSEHRAVRRLQEAGLLPRSRHRARVG